MFLGGTPHGGVTYRNEDGNEMEMYPSFHMYYYSIHHPQSDELLLEYCTPQVVYKTPQ